MSYDAPQLCTASAKRARLSSRLAQTLTASAMLLVSASTTGCGLQHSEYTIRADSVGVSPSASTEAVSIRVHGFVARDGCGKLERVESSVRQDTLVRRFVGETRRALCIQMPVSLDYTEFVYVPAGAAVVYAVQQPDGTKLVRLLSPP